MYKIIFEEHEVYEFAAEQLARYYSRISGEFISRYKQNVGDGIPVFLGSPDFIKANGCEVPVDKLVYDGYFVKVTDDAVFVSGKEPRSVLYGVYRLLEDVGCKWMFPGPDGEIIPQIPSLKFGNCEIIDNPDFEIRASCDDTHQSEIIDTFVEEHLEKFDWAAKNRLNSYFGVLGITGEGFLKPMMLREITKRGFMLEVGGHATRHFVNKNLFETKPELFRMKDGVRRVDGNFCSSNPEAVQMVVDGIDALLKKEPSIKRFHIWFDDAYEGSWCECEKCKDLTAAQQMLNVVNAVAKAFPDLGIDFILYHDSGDVSSITEKLPKNVCAEYAPRERCYAHRISDENCKRNTVYYEQLCHAHTVFESIYPFEYYGDMILFNKMGVNLQKTIHDDFIDYKNLGVNAMKILMFNRYSWFAYKLNMITFARSCWKLGADYMDIRKELCEEYFGNAADAMMKYYELQEKFTEYMLEFCGYDEVYDIRNITPKNKEFGEKHLCDLEKAETILDDMKSILENALQKAESIKVKRLLNSELACLRFTKKEATITREFMSARHRISFENLEKSEYNEVMEKLIDLKKELEADGRSVPDYLTGINGKCTFPDHLCEDQITFYTDLKNKPDAK